MTAQPAFGSRTKWPTFLKAHWKSQAAKEFFSVEACTIRGFVTYYVRFFVDLATRSAHIVGITPNPDELWMMQIGCIGLSFGGHTKASIGGACADSIPINSRVYRAMRFLLTRAKISFCCSDARFNTFEYTFFFSSEDAVRMNSENRVDETGGAFLNLESDIIIHQ